MYSNLKVVILGDYVKLTSVNLKTSSNIIAQERKNENEKNLKKLENNVVRAKNTINDIALANDFTYFFTLTFKPLYDRYNLDALLNKFRNHLKVMRRFLGVNIKYLIVPEQHKDGAWHFHGFFTDEIKCFLYYNEYAFLSIKPLENLGHINISEIRDKRRVSSYVTKYVVKNLGGGIKKFRNSYYCSTGLSHGEKVIDKLYDNEYFNEQFFDYSNDFCRRKVITLQEYYNFKPFIDKL